MIRLLCAITAALFSGLRSQGGLMIENLGIPIAALWYGITRGESR